MSSYTSGIEKKTKMNQRLHVRVLIIPSPQSSDSIKAISVTKSEDQCALLNCLIYLTWLENVDIGSNLAPSPSEHMNKCNENCAASFNIVLPILPGYAPCKL